MNYPVLQQLGLKEKEAALYEALLPLGEVPVSDLTSVFKEHPQIVYRLLDQLAAKGLVVMSTKKHRKVVRAEDPRILEQTEERKLEELRLALPELMALQKASKGAIVRVSRGNEAVQELRLRAFSLLPEGSTYFIIGGSGDRFYEVMGEANERAEKLRIKKKLRKKLVTFESQRKGLLKGEKYPQFCEYRFLSQNFSAPTSTNIFGDTTAILIWTDEPLVICIESKEVADSYRSYFQALWKMGKA
jgi:sugar-specific transcriptional regulator TrmB